MKTITHIKSLSFIMALFCVVNFGFGQILTFDFAGLAGNEISASSNSNDINLGASTITRGSGLTKSINGDRFNAISWAPTSIETAVTGNDYMEFTIAPNNGYQFDVTTIVINFQRSETGPRGIALRSSIDGYSTNIDSEKPIAFIVSTTEVFTFTIAQANSATAVTYRFYCWAGAGTGTGGFEGNGNDIIVNGTVSALPACGATTTWTNGAWDNGTPTLSTNAVIEDDYNTSFGGSQTSFSSCSLIVTENAKLDIADNTFVEIQNDITVDAGSIISVQPYGTVLQIDDLGAVTNNGSILVNKETAPANAWYEYTYWSSPVSGETVGQGLFESGTSRRYVFNGQNFLDATAETANNNATIVGQDDIDDDNNDWQRVNGATVMQPGVGYAATHDETVFNFTLGGLPKQIIYVFEGDFNNGVKTVPVYRNDSELLDYNWNFIGNPYPSAINADLFLAANSDIATNIVSTKSLNGAIFLWSQNTAPSSTANGNQALNFSNDDYAIINAVGENAGGDGVTPSRIIPSGQGFFVSMSNSAPATLFSGTAVFKANNDVVFNNSMRIKGTTDNSQFFKSSNSKKKSTSIPNKIWVNLTSDNGVFNQILVGYVNGATNNDDGISFDTNKYSTKGAALYSSIEGSDDKFVIQGKAPDSLYEDEIINLGFSTNINVPTIYTLSIPRLEGDFLTGNTIYLKDNLLNKAYDLSANNYTFTSEVGEFNNRFEIVFKASTLFTNDFGLNANALKIMALKNDDVQFSTSNNLKIKTISIFDILGRQLYAFKGNNSSEIYNLSTLSSTVYIAKVSLSNGIVITKKAIKK